MTDRDLEIEDLKLRARRWRDECDDMRAERDTLRAQLAASQAEVSNKSLVIAYWRDKCDALQTQLAEAQPERAPLSDDEIRTAYESVYQHRAVMGHGSFSFARAIEAAHGIKQGGQQ